MATSTIPAAIDGLIAVLAASPDLKSVKIIDGQPTTETPKDFVAVAYAEDGDAVSGMQEPASLGNLRRSETYEITCMVSAWNGGTVMKSVRDRAFEIFGAVETAVRAGGTLDGSVTFADISRIGLSQYQTEQGAVADIMFSVAVKITRI